MGVFELLVVLVLVGVLPLGLVVAALIYVARRRSAVSEDLRRELARLHDKIAAVHEDVRALREHQADVTLMLDDLPKRMGEGARQGRSGGS